MRARVASSQAARSALGLLGVEQAGVAERVPAPSTVDGARSAGTSAACCNCSSCTVHSTSERPPRPSLVWVAGSAPRGSRSRSTRALIRRISATCSSVSPSAGYRIGSIRATKSAPSSSSPATGTARSSACTSQTETQRS